MTARKGASKDEAAAPPAASSGGPDTEKDGEQPSGPPPGRVELSKDVTGDAPKPDAAVRFAPDAGTDDADPGARQDPPREPVRKYQLERPVPFRAGGYVCTERGWVLDTTPEQEL